MAMDMDLSNEQNYQKEMSSQTLESMLACTKPQQEKKPRPQDEVQKCPRCDSSNTKFCYYNNYSLTQPRYFCKSCRRYWTKGGTLRNVPVGGGCRKKQRSSSSKRSSPDNQSLMTTTTTCPNNQILSCLTQFSYDPNDLSLAFSRLQNQESGQLVCPESIQTETIFPNSLCLTNFGNSDAHHDVLENRGMCNPSSEVISHVGFLDALRGGFLETPPNGFLNRNLYYYGSIGNNGNNMGQVESGSHGEMVTNFDQEVRSGATTSIALKEEMCSDNKILWGYPWQVNGDGNVADFEYSSRQNWNGLGVPSGHGLLNSPLM